MLILIVATVLVALLAAAALPLVVLWACAESRENGPSTRRSLFDFALLRTAGLLRFLQNRGARPLLLTYRRDDRGRFRKVARG